MPCLALDVLRAGPLTAPSRPTTPAPRTTMHPMLQRRLVAAQAGGNDGGGGGNLGDDLLDFM